MTMLGFTVREVTPEPYSVTPQLSARVAVTESTEAVVHAIALRCQVRIEPQRRPYTDDEAAGLLDLFGPRTRWAQTLRPYLWLQSATLVPGFTGAREVDLPLPCTYDFQVAGSKYLHALADGVVPLAFLFSGTVITRGTTGFAVEHVPWDCDAAFAMPVAVWQQVMDQHFPGTAWMRLGRDAFTALERYRGERGLLSADEAINELLTSARVSDAAAAP